MANVEIKTNGYELSDEVKSNIRLWKTYLDENLEVKEFNLFYWTEKLVFADCILTNGHYAQYCIGDTSIHFNGHTCSNEEYKIFSSATIKDDCYAGCLIAEAAK